MLPLGVAGGSAVEAHDIDHRIRSPGLRHADVTEITAVDPAALASSRGAAVGRSDGLGGRRAFPYCRGVAASPRPGPLQSRLAKRAQTQAVVQLHGASWWFDGSKTRTGAAA